MRTPAHLPGAGRSGRWGPQRAIGRSSVGRRRCGCPGVGPERQPRRGAALVAHALTVLRGNGSVRAQPAGGDVAPGAGSCRASGRPSWTARAELLLLHLAQALVTALISAPSPRPMQLFAIVPECCLHLDLGGGGAFPREAAG